MLSDMDLYFLKYAKDYSRYSKDKTKIGAIITPNDSYGLQFLGGYNHLPRCFSAEKEAEYLANRELKNRFIIHAEIDAVCKGIEYQYRFNANTLYVWGLHSCARCAGFVCDTGLVTRLVSVDTGTTVDPNKWNEEAEIAAQIYKDSNIPVQHFTLPEFANILAKEERFLKSFFRPEEITKDIRAILDNASKL